MPNPLPKHPLPPRTFPGYPAPIQYLIPRPVKGPIPIGPVPSPRGIVLSPLNLFSFRSYYLPPGRRRFRYFVSRFPGDPEYGNRRIVLFPDPFPGLPLLVLFRHLAA